MNYVHTPGFSERSVYLLRATCQKNDGEENYTELAVSELDDRNDIKNSVSIYEADLKKPIFLIVGGEKRGISSSVLSQADEIVRIDYGRKFDAALSAASASTIIAFEIYRQNK